MKINILPLPRDQSISQLISSAESIKLGGRSMGMLEFCQATSMQTWVAYVEEELICCWGLIPPTALSDQAYLWMHSTPEVRKYSFLLVRHSQLVIEEMLKRYPKITGDCLIEATDSIRWLRWLGARFGEPTGSYIPFTIRRK